MSSHRDPVRKMRYAKKMKQNRPVPYFNRLKKTQKVKYNFKRHNWRRSHLKI